MKTKINLVLVSFILFVLNGYSQDKKSFVLKQPNDIGDIVMTWNKTTPEQEMKDDIKTLAKHGVTINYANVKRNDNKEITAIDVTFEDKEGNKGSLYYNQNKPIPTIQFYKQGDAIGFGEPSNVFGDMAMLDNLMDDDKVIYGLDYRVNPPNGGTNPKSRTMIKRDDREPLVIEDGKVIEGGLDYSKEEIDEILKRNDRDISGNGGFKSFNYKGNQDFSEQLQHIQKQLDELKQSQENSEKELQQAEEKIKKAENDVKESKKEIKKTKSTLKNQKV